MEITLTPTLLIAGTSLLVTLGTYFYYGVLDKAKNRSKVNVIEKDIENLSLQIEKEIEKMNAKKVDKELFLTTMTLFKERVDDLKDGIKDIERSMNKNKN